MVKYRNYFRHILTVGCQDTWEFNNTMEYEVGASYDIFLTGEDVGIARYSSQIITTVLGCVRV